MANQYNAIFNAIVRADAGQAVTELRRVDGQVEKTTGTAASKFSQFGMLAKGAMAAVGTAAAFELGRRVVDAASDLNESINAVNKTFGGTSSAILQLGDDAAQTVGLSKRAFNELAVTFSSFAKTVSAEGGGTVTGVIDDLTKRAADFASVMNLDVNEAAQIFLSTLAGETEPIRRFGKDISAAAVEQFLLAEGLADSKKEITEQLKVVGRYQLLMKQTEDTAGDFVETSDGLANSQRILQADLENVAATVGQVVVPALEATLGPIIDIVDAVRELDSLTGGSVFTAIEAGIRRAFGDQTFVLRETADAVVDYQEIVRTAAADQARLTNAMKASTDEQLLAERATRKEEEAKRAAAVASQLIQRELEREKQRRDDVIGRLERTSQALDELYAAQQQFIGSAVNVQRSQLQASEAVQRYQESLVSAEASERDRELAMLDAVSAIDRTAQASVEYASAQAAATGETLSAKQQNELYVQQLQNVASTLDPNSPLRKQLDQYIWSLASIPTNIRTNVTLTAANFSASSALASAIFGGVKLPAGGYDPRTGQWVAGATGGIVNRPTVAMIGEAGPEAVVPLNRTPGNLPLGSMGGVTNIINVYPPVAVDKTQMGREIVEAINASLRAGGQRIAA